MDLFPTHGSSTTECHANVAANRPSEWERLWSPSRIGPSYGCASAQENKKGQREIPWTISYPERASVCRACSPGRSCPQNWPSPSCKKSRRLRTQHLPCSNISFRNPHKISKNRSLILRRQNPVRMLRPKPRRRNHHHHHRINSSRTRKCPCCKHSNTSDSNSPPKFLKSPRFHRFLEWKRWGRSSSSSHKFEWRCPFVTE
mmetsp:Transcript_38191/g.73457  ORF Transcript_38191/g.73457 Transcript_38191/m.73457 type:complete len:201 (-) Transcript_38191:250-852(-)